jgi:ribonuclease E
MENNNYNNPFSAENAEEQAHVEAPVVEAPVEPVVDPVVEAPVVETPVVEAPVVEAPVVEAPVVEAPEAEEPVQALGFTKTGAIGSMAADGPKKAVKPEADLSEKVAIHSTKSVRWEEVGSISKGYNIVTKAQADKWLTRNHVRIATPEEVKKAFG